MRKFDVKQSDLTVEGRFDKPAFPIVGPEQRNVHEQILARLAPFGTTPDNVFFESSGSLGNRGTTFNIPSLNAGVKVMIGKVELGFNDMNRVEFAQLRSIASSVFGALDRFIPGLGYLAFHITLNYHGIVEGMSPSEFVAQYVTRAPSLGTKTGSAAGFYYGPQESRHQLGVIVDPSVAVPNALYMRINATFDGRKLSHDALPAVGANAVRDVFTAFELQTDLDFGDGENARV